MSWLFSQALVEAYSEANCLDGKQFAQLNVMPTQRQFWRNDKMMDCSNLSQFGLTSKLLTEDRGKELLTLYLAGFHAKTSVLPEKAQALTENEADFGWKWQGSFAKYDRDSSSWKTRQCSLLGGLDEFSETWPGWGLMLNGECLELTTREPAIKEQGSGYVPTPTASDWKGGSINGRDSEFKHWLKRRHGGTYPNPRRVEEMMLWPIGWTDLEPLGTDKFQRWLQKHSIC